MSSRRATAGIPLSAMSLAVNPQISNLGVKPPILDRTHFSGPSSSHHGSKGGKKSIALTALTLLSFLFFLNILQNCLQEHMAEMNAQNIVINVMQTRLREAQNRKGDLDILNGSDKETRTITTTTQLTQIPVKLRTSEKAERP